MLSRSPYRVLIIIGCLPFITGCVNEEIEAQHAQCTNLLKDFAKSSAAFTFCTISHARPISVCRECISSYLDVVGAYDNITKLGKTVGRDCTSELENLDRLDVFKQGFEYIDNLWKTALCDNCFIKNRTTGYPTTQLLELVLEILNASSVHQVCINETHISTAEPDLAVCKKCADSYRRVNDIFNQNKRSHPMCMDVTDLVNNTRNEWSNFGCSLGRRKPETTMISTAIGISMLPFIFYLMTYCFTSEEIHPLIEKNRWNGGFVR